MYLTAFSTRFTQQSLDQDRVDGDQRQVRGPAATPLDLAAGQAFFQARERRPRQLLERVPLTIFTLQRARLEPRHVEQVCDQMPPEPFRFFEDRFLEPALRGRLERRPARAASWPRR